MKVFKNAKTKTGETIKVPVLILSEGEVQDMERNDEGMCFGCGAISEGIEPDATKYKCYECGEHRVYGLEMSVLSGRIQFKYELLFSQGD